METLINSTKILMKLVFFLERNSYCWESFLIKQDSSKQLYTDHPNGSLIIIPNNFPFHILVTHKINTYNTVNDKTFFCPFKKAFSH